MFYLTMHLTHFIYGIGNNIWWQRDYGFVLKGCVSLSVGLYFISSSAPQLYSKICEMYFHVSGIEHIKVAS